MEELAENSSGQEEEKSSRGLMVIGVLLSLLVAQMVSHSLDIYQIKFIHMSGIHILIGLFMGVLWLLFLPEGVDFEHSDFPQEIFFEGLLPPIIFAAGFDLNGSYFLKNIRIVLSMGIIGTIINFFIIGTLFIWAQNQGLIIAANSSGLLTHAECLQFAAVLSATDAICVVTLIDSEAVPHVFNVLAAEGVINDAVAIILYTSIASLEESDTIYALNAMQIFIILGKVIKISILSGLYGIISGAIASVYFKRLREPGEVAMEGLILFLFSYLSYQAAELLDASGIISVFFTGFMISKYTFWSLSSECRETFHVLVHFLSESCEKLIFVLLGLFTFRYSFAQYWSITLIAFTFMAIIMGRVVLVLVTTNITNLFTPKHSRMGWSEQLIFIWSGLVRGAIAFCLILAHSSEHQEIIITATLCVVIISTLLVGSLSSIVLASLPIKNSNRKRSTFFESSSAVKQWLVKKDRSVLQKLLGGESVPRLDGKVGFVRRSVSSNLYSGSDQSPAQGRTSQLLKGDENLADPPISCLKKSTWGENSPIAERSGERSLIHSRVSDSNVPGLEDKKSTFRNPQISLLSDVRQVLGEANQQKKCSKLTPSVCESKNKEGRAETQESLLKPPRNAPRKSSFEVKIDPVTRV